MSSVMIVDGSLLTSITWIAEYIDNLNQDEQNSLAQLVSELATPDDVPQKVYFSLAEASHSLLKAPEDEFEGVFNLLLYILSQSTDFSGFIPVVLGSLNIETTETKQLLILAVLGNFFNVIDAKNKLRFDVLSKIIDFSAANGTLRQIVSQLNQLPQWLEMWGTDQETVTDVYTKIVDLTEKHVGAYQAFSLLVDGVKCSNSDVLAKRLVETALGNSFTYDFDELLKVPAVASLEDVTLKAVAKGDCASLEGASEEALGKARVIKFAQLAVSQSLITYDQITKETGLSSDMDIEALAIDVVKADLVQGRMDQFERVFTVERSIVVGEFTAEHWKMVDERLDAWKTELRKHTQAVLGSKSPEERLAVPI